MHTLPEILTVMDLMTIYATDSQTNPDQQRRNREAAGHSEFILRETFRRIINASTRYHNANIPVVRPHQFQEPLHDTQQEIMEQLYLAAEDVCDILNLYPRPPENDARRIILTLTNTIEHILDRHDDEWPIQSGWTRQAHWTPSQILQDQITMLDSETDTISLYDTPYNELCTYHHTPTLEDLENPSAIPCQTEIVPITFTATVIRLITAYTVPRKPSRQSDILLFSTDTPQPILSTFRSSTPFDTHTYAIIYNDMQNILDTHAHDTEAKLNCIDIDPDNGEEQFYNTAHFYDRLKKTVLSMKKRTTLNPYENHSKHLQRYMRSLIMPECSIL